MFRLEEMSGIIPEKVGEFGVNQRFFWAEKGLPFSGKSSKLFSQFRSQKRFLMLSVFFEI